MASRIRSEQSRLQAAELFAQGKTPLEVAVVVGRSERAVYGWRRVWDAGGAAALKIQVGTGHSLDLIEEQWRRLRLALEGKPGKVGMRGAAWNPSVFAEFATKVCVRKVNRFMARRLMVALGYTYKRPPNPEGRQPRAGTWVKSSRSRIPLAPDPALAPG